MQVSDYRCEKRFFLFHLRLSTCAVWCSYYSVVFCFLRRQRRLQKQSYFNQFLSFMSFYLPSYSSASVCVRLEKPIKKATERPCITRHCVSDKSAYVSVHLNLTYIYIYYLEMIGWLSKLFFWSINKSWIYAILIKMAFLKNPTAGVDSVA